MQMGVFVQNCKKMEREIFAFCVITFRPIKTYTHLNLRFVKYENIYCKNTARNGRKMAIYESQILVISLYIIQDEIRTKFFGQNNLRNRSHIDNISFPGAKHETLSSS